MTVRISLSYQLLLQVMHHHQEAATICASWGPGGSATPAKVVRMRVGTVGHLNSLHVSGLIDAALVFFR